MPDFRVHLANPPAPDAVEIALAPAETHHLVNVNRARTGDPVVAFDGRGTEWTCRLDRVEGKKSAVLRVAAVATRAPLPCLITLGQGLPKGGTMDDIVRQATELGATRIAPLATDRSEVHLDADRADKKLEKWRTTAVEAAKQCGNPWVPEISALAQLPAFLASPAAREAELRLVASLHPGARPLRSVLADFRANHDGRAPRSAAWLIGPEGDLTAEEVAAALAAGWIPVTLGPLVLRCDTAAAYALAALRCETEATELS
jgi:16S rRNA (uracil1498-N3)-methyltransferase